MSIAPFPYFGGKTMVAPLIWRALGQPKHYIEPFFGSGAVLLNRPEPDPTRYLETVNDKDGHLANVWRALQSAPDEVARWCDWPVNHADLNARRRVLNGEYDGLLDALIADDTYYNPKLAGYWIWAASCWIGSGLTCPNARPNIGDGGSGVHKIGKRPHIIHGGKGVHKIGQVPHPTNTSAGVQEPYNVNLYTWFRELSERLRYVRVVCGDWSRVCGGDWQDNLGVVGMYFDPPYSAEAGRDNNLYGEESLTIAHDVRTWCIERGSRPTYRIALSGYYEEHTELLDYGWTVHRWSACGGYGKLGGKNGGTRGQDNRHREAIFFSPHCLRGGACLPLFEGL